MSELPTGWSSATLRELGNWIGGGTPSKRVDAFWRGDIPWVSPKDMKVERIRDTVDHITAEAVDASSTNLVPAGSVLVVTRSGILRHSLPVAVTEREVALNQDLKGVNPHKGVSGDWLAWFLRRRAREILATCSKAGTTVNNLETSKLLATPVPVPPPEEQRRIVAAIEEQFSRLDAAAAELRNAELRLEPMRERVLASAVRGWSARPLGELLREPLRNGHSAKAAPGGGVRTLTLTAVTRGDFSEGFTKLTDADPDRVRDLWLRPGDVFIERSNTPDLVGTAALFRGPADWAIFPDLLIRVRVGDGLLPEFLEIVLKASPAKRYFRNAAQGIAGSMPKIDQGAVERLMVPLPPVGEQRRIIAEVEERLSVIAAMRQAIDSAQRRSATLRRSILERAFRGELVPQDPTDEPASVLLERIRAEQEAGRPPRRRSSRRPARSGHAD